MQGNGKDGNGSDPPNPGMEHPAFKAGQWKKGQSGNPTGRPRRKPFHQIVGDVLAESVTSKDGVTMEKEEVVARILVDELMKRNVRLITAFLDRVWPSTMNVNLRPDDGEEAAEVDLRPQRMEEVAEILAGALGEPIH